MPPSAVFWSSSCDVVVVGVGAASGVRAGTGETTTGGTYVPVDSATSQKHTRRSNDLFSSFCGNLDVAAVSANAVRDDIGESSSSRRSDTQNDA